MNYVDMARIRKLRDAEAAAEINDAARLVNELQREFPGMTRTNAVQEAERIQRERGIGWSIVHQATGAAS